MVIETEKRAAAPFRYAGKLGGKCQGKAMCKMETRDGQQDGNDLGTTGEAGLWAPYPV